ncbi:MAG: FG-GAP repeat domain-containing protein [Phycisphaerae bacterium]
MDLNADGNNDILSGSYSRMGGSMAGLFQVLWGNPDGTFKKAETLNGTDGEPLIIPSSSDGPNAFIDAICTRPTAVDWDSDGDLDLVVGNFAGKFFLFDGEGKGKFSPKCSAIKAGDEPLKIAGHHSDPFLIDWDKDGDLDVLSGSSEGGVQIAENTAGAKKTPVLKQFKPLIKVEGEMVTECRPSEVKRPAGSTRVWAADMNGDGKLDVLVGDSINLVSPAKGVSEQDFKKRYAEWNEKSAKLFAPQSQVTEKDQEEHNRKISAHYEARGEFMEEDRTGFVWVYLQK